MQDPKEYLQENLDTANLMIKFAFVVLLFSLLMLSRIILFFFSDTSPEYYEATEPWWGYVMNIVGAFSLIGGINLLYGGIKDRKRYRDFLKVKEAAAILELEVLDKFTFIKLLPGDEGPLENQFVIGSREGNWRLSEKAAPYFKDVQPGNKIKAAVLKGKQRKEIIEFEIIEQSQAPESLLPSMIQEKIVSEVKVTAYEQEGIRVNKLHFVKKIRHYFIINKQVVEVSREVFYKFPLYAEFSPARQVSVS